MLGPLITPPTLPALRCQIRPIFTSCVALSNHFLTVPQLPHL